MQQVRLLIASEKPAKMCINRLDKGMESMGKKKKGHASKKESQAFGAALKESADGNNQGTWTWTDFVDALRKLEESIKK